MLQSNDDRWPLWDDKFDVEPDNTVEETKTANGEQVENKISSEHKISSKITDKKILARKEKQEQNIASARQELLRFASLGTELLASVLVGTLLGWVVSRLFGGAPWVLAIGVVIGAAAGFLNIYRAIIESEQEEEQQKRGSSK
mgnify:CR=1 FL=1